MSVTRNKSAPTAWVFVIILFFFAALVGVLIYKNRDSEQTIKAGQLPAATTVDEAADNFLRSNVGEENFKAYYIFDKARSGYATKDQSKYDFMAYHFSPMKAITGSAEDDVIMVQVNRDNFEEIYADMVPDCVRDSSLCNFYIDNQKATEIAKNNLHAEDIYISLHTKFDEHAKSKGMPFVIVAASCSQKKSVFIDYRNGNVLGVERGCGQID